MGRRGKEVKMKTHMWTTKDGTKVEISSMPTQHIKNAIKVCERNGYISPQTLHFYLNCKPPQGEMAGYAFEQELDDVIGRVPSLVMGQLERELEKREKEGR
jgi:hypothetical protein